MKKSLRFIAFVLIIATISSLFTFNAAAASLSLEDKLSVLAEKYGFEIEFIDYENTRQDSHSNFVPVACFDTVEQFAAALENGDYRIPQIDHLYTLPIEIPADSTVYSESDDFTRTFGYGNRNLGNITLGLDLCATISYTYNTVNSRRYYTSFTDFVPYFSGLNIGYHFDLTTWFGIVCSDISYSNGQWYYTSASSGEGYYISWGGNISWGIEINGALIGLSDYLGDWFIGMGDFSNI